MNKHDFTNCKRKFRQWRFKLKYDADYRESLYFGLGYMIIIALTVVTAKYFKGY